MKLYLAAALGLMLLGSFPAQAAYVTGGELLKLCTSPRSGDAVACMNYIGGVIDYHVLLQSLGTAPTTDFCLPENLPLEKAAVTVLLYLKKSPQHAAFVAAPAVAMALHENFPCKNKK